MAAVLTIGTDLVRGEAGDAGARGLAARLTGLGFAVQELVAVDEDPEHVAEALRRLGAGVRVLLVTGTAGATAVMVDAAARAAGVEQVEDETLVEAVRRHFQSSRKALDPSHAALARLPRGAGVLGGAGGLVSAFVLRIGASDCYFLPGTSGEVERAFDELVARRVGPLAVADSYRIVLHTYGLSEGALGERLAGVEAAFPGVKLGYGAAFPEVDVRVLARAADGTSARSLAERAATEVRLRLGDVVYGEEDDSFAAAIGRDLRSRRYTLAVAESCTGGLVGALLTAVPGSSDYLLLDAVTYSNAAKERVLAVPSEVLRGHGAVSAECVAAMAEGARRVAGADLGVATSGVAGPGGGSSEKPVGTVYFALAAPWGTAVYRRHLAGDRARVQREAAYVALGLVREACRGPVAAPNPVCG